MFKITLIVAVIFCCGCASISYETGDEKFTYSRVGSQKVSGLEVERDKNGITKVKIKSSNGDLGEVGQVIKDLAVMAAQGQPHP